MHPPYRSSSIRHLLMSSSSTHSITLPGSALPPRSLLDLLNVSSRGGSPMLPPVSHITPHLSLPALCHQRISGLLGISPAESGSVFQRVLSRVLDIREACEVIEEAYCQNMDSIDGELYTSFRVA